MNSEEISRVLSFLGGNSRPDRQEFLERIADLHPDIFATIIWLKDAENGHYRLDRSFHKSYPDADMPTGLVGATVDIENEEKDEEDPRLFFDRISDWLSNNDNGGHHLGIPIRGPSSFLGYLMVHSRSDIERPLCESGVEEALLGGLARNIEVSRETKILRAINRVREEIGMPISLARGKSIFMESLKIAKETVDCELALLIKRNGVGRWMIAGVAHDYGDTRNLDRVLNRELIQKCFVEMIADKRKTSVRLINHLNIPMNLKDGNYNFDLDAHRILVESEVLTEPVGGHTWMGVPVRGSMDENEIVDSVLVFINKKKKYCKLFSATDAECVKSIAELLATSVPLAEYSSCIDELFKFSFPDIDDLNPYLEKIVDSLSGVHSIKIGVFNSENEKIINFGSGVRVDDNSVRNDVKPLELLDEWHGELEVVMDKKDEYHVANRILGNIKEQLETVLNMALPKNAISDVFRKLPLSVSDFRSMSGDALIAPKDDFEIRKELSDQLSGVKCSAASFYLGSEKIFTYSVDDGGYDEELVAYTKKSISQFSGSVEKRFSFSGKVGTAYVRMLNTRSSGKGIEVFGILFIEDKEPVPNDEESSVRRIRTTDITHFLRRISIVFLLRETSFLSFPVGLSQKCWEDSDCQPMWGNGVTLKEVETISLAFDLRKSTLAMQNSVKKYQYDLWLRGLIAELKTLALSEGGIYGQFTGDGVQIHFVKAYCLELGKSAPVECAYRCAVKMLKVTARRCQDLQQNLQYVIAGLGAGVAIDMGVAFWDFESRTNPTIRGIGIVGASRLCEQAPAGAVRMSNYAYSDWKRDSNMRVPEFEQFLVETQEIDPSSGLYAWEYFPNLS